ncbi:MAG: arylesterase [Gemmatimonadota bacterium]
MTRIIAAALAVVILSACDDAPAPVPDTVPGPASAPAAAPTEPRRVIVFIGTSLTAGYGIGADLAFPAMVQQKIDSAGLPYRVVNAGISGETSAGGLRRVDWLLQQPVDVLVLELGANDGLRGLDTDSMKSNLDQVILHTLEKNPEAKIVIAGMEAPRNLGPRYTTRFAAVFHDLARKHDAVLIPFLLDGVAGQPDLNQADAIHPTEQGQRIIANTVWRYLEPLLRRE